MPPATRFPCIAVALVLLTASLSSCSDSPTPAPGHLLVSVTQDSSSPAVGKLVEVAGTKLRGYTDKDGLVEFELEPGSYTVRIYDINTPGPSRPFVEEVAEVSSGETTRVDVYECTYCR